MRGVDLRSMPFGTFLDVVYSYMVERLPPNEERKNYRLEFDNTLGVRNWSIPGQEAKRVPVEPGAPAWWAGDEEASQSFLTAMGGRLGGRARG